MVLVTSKRYQKEMEALRRVKNGVRKGKSEIRRFGVEGARIPKGLEEKVLPEKECLECRVCRQVGDDVEPRIIEGLDFARLKGLAVPQLDLCNLCATRIDQGKIRAADYLGAQLVVRGEIRTRVVEREADRQMPLKRKLELVAMTTEENDPYRLLRARLGKL